MTDQNTFAIAELQQKANNGDAQAQFDLALCYANGTDIEKNLELAFEWHKKAAEQGHVNAQFALGLYYSPLMHKLFNKWVMAKFINNEYVDPALDLAFLEAAPMKQGVANDDLAYLWLKKTAEQNHTEGNYWLGICYRDGIGTQQNDELAFDSFKKAAEQGYADACYWLAHCYRDGKGVRQSDNRAYEWLTKAVENAEVEPEAYLFLGELYADGKGVTQSDELAFKWFAKAAEKKIAEAQYLLASCYEHGIGVERNMNLADIWYESASEEGYFEADAQFSLANRYLQGIDIEKNHELGMKWMIRSAHEGHADAYNWLINAFLFLAIPKELLDKVNDAELYKFVFDWCSKKRLGNNETEANLVLGILYSSGKGVEQNDKSGFDCFEKAKKTFGDLEVEPEDVLTDLYIQLYLSNCYAQGKGVKKDLPKAASYSSYSEYISTLSSNFMEGIGSTYKTQNINVFLTLLRIEIYKFFKEYDLAKEYIKKVFENTGGVDKSFEEICLATVDQEEELDKYNQQLEEKNRELNNLVAMFAHNFLGTLQCIRSNAEHDNNPNVHLKTVKMMGGALTAFSILSADDDKLVEQLKQDNAGETSLQQSLANNLALAISQLLGKTNKDKIVNLYLRHLHKTQQIESNTTSEELRTNRDYRKKWQALQHQWEDEFNALFSEKADLPELQQWITDNFFPIEIIGLDSCNISFKEYGITDSIFLIVFMEIFVNAFKYMDVIKNKPLVLKLYEEDQCYKLVCENSSSQETGRGTHKGMDFLKTIAKKLKGHFITESTKSSFKVTFAIPSELLK